MTYGGPVITGGAGRLAADLPAGLVDVLHRNVPGRLDQAVVAGQRQPPQAVAARTEAAEATISPVRVAALAEGGRGRCVTNSGPAERPRRPCIAAGRTRGGRQRIRGSGRGRGGSRR